MTLIHLHGSLTCSTQDQRRTLIAALPVHMRKSLTEPGCLFYEITQAESPLSWQIEAGFASPAAHETYEAELVTSPFGVACAGVQRQTNLAEKAPEIRRETPSDARAISGLLNAAFGGPDEAELVEKLRTTQALALSLTAKFGTVTLGHIAFSPVIAPFPAWALAPLAVRAPVRSQGIGAALTRAGLALAQKCGIQAVFVLGDPAYFSRFGFSAEAAQGYQSPYAGAHFQMINLAGSYLPKGPIRHAPAFDAL
ncbi:GNAT family N-acetyltransferase [Rhodobacter lacus]|uniref:GNAT family N-acetyltransferase n=1 Tax=Rhodobacter lacus TaxID=1641972 RepID=A0ABW5AAW2_9RHOB